MTLKEVKIVCDAFVKSKKAEADNLKAEIYSTAVLTASFIGASFSGKQIPSSDEIWGTDEQTEEGITNNDIRVTELFKDFVAHHNKGD